MSQDLLVFTRRCRRCYGFRCSNSTPESCDAMPSESEIPDGAIVMELFESGMVFIEAAGKMRPHIKFRLPDSIRVSHRREPNEFSDKASWKLSLKSVPDSPMRGLIISRGCTFARLKEVREYLLIRLSSRRVNQA